MNIQGKDKLTFNFKSENELAVGEKYKFNLKFDFYLRQEISMSD